MPRVFWVKYLQLRFQTRTLGCVDGILPFLENRLWRTTNFVFFFFFFLSAIFRVTLKPASQISTDPCPLSRTTEQELELRDTEIRRGSRTRIRPDSKCPIDEQVIIILDI